MSQLSALYSALAGGMQSPTGGMDSMRGGGIPSAYTPGMRFAAPAQPAMPGQLAGFNRDGAQWAEQARMQAEDEANMARLAAQRSGVPAQGAAPPVPGGIAGGYNRLVDALNPRQ